MANAVEIEYLLPRTLLRLVGQSAWRTDRRTGQRVRSTAFFDVYSALAADPDPRARRNLALSSAFLRNRDFSFDVTEDQRLQGTDSGTLPLTMGAEAESGTPDRIRALGSAGRADGLAGADVFGPTSAADAAYSMAHPELSDRRSELRQQLDTVREQQMRVTRRVTDGDITAAGDLHDLSTVLADLAPLTESLEEHYRGFLDRFDRTTSDSLAVTLPLDALPRIRRGDSDPEIDLKESVEVSELLDQFGLVLVLLDDDADEAGQPRQDERASDRSTEAARPADVQAVSPTVITYRVPREVRLAIYQQGAQADELVYARSVRFLACDARCEQRTLSFSESSWGQRLATYAFAASGALIGMTLGERGGVVRLPGAAPVPRVSQHEPDHVLDVRARAAERMSVGDPVQAIPAPRRHELPRRG